VRINNQHGTTVLNGDANTVFINGSPDLIIINGDANIITVYYDNDNVWTITILGNRNQVRLLGQTPSAKAPNVIDKGENNLFSPPTTTTSQIDTRAS
jgi:hypothetical protein